MSIIGWFVLGLTAGFVASKVVNKTGGNRSHPLSSGGGLGGDAGQG